MHRRVESLTAAPTGTGGAPGGMGAIPTAASTRPGPAGAGAGAGAILTGAALWFGPGTAVHWPPMARLLGIPRTLDRAEGVALTFDDGPHPEGTAAVLEALRQRGAKATFFLVGEQVERYPSVVAEVVSEGHELALHGYRHRNQMRLGPRALGADLDRALAVIGEAYGRAPSFYRPPYGIFTPAGLAAVRRRGFRPLLWSQWGRDWRARRSPERIAAQATGGVVAGDVILLHDADWYSASRSHERTAAAVPRILDELDRRGLTPVKASPAG